MLRDDKQGVKVIYIIKKKILKKVLSHYYDKVKEKIEDKKENGWSRTTTPKFRQMLMDSLQENSKKEHQTIKKAVNMFCLIYDDDDPYAYMFHDFYNKCRAGKKEYNLPTIRKKEKYLTERGKVNYDKNEVEKEVKEDLELA